MRSAFTPIQTTGNATGLARGIFSVLVLLLAMMSTKSFAQTAGSITGHLADPSARAFRRADVTLTNVGQNTSRATKSTDCGRLHLHRGAAGDVYPPGEAHRLQDARRATAFEVQVQQSVRLDFTLQVGAVTESVEVSTTGALLQADNPTLGTVMENAEIKELPLNGRNYLGLVALASNVNTLSSGSGQAGSRLGGDRASQSIAVGGQRIMFDYYTLDGVSKYRSGLQYLYRAAFDGRHPGVQGSDRRLFGGVRP